jgi:hypothetical protein
MDLHSFVLLSTSLPGRYIPNLAINFADNTEDVLYILVHRAIEAI